MPSRIHSICLTLEVLHQAALFTPVPDHLGPLDDINEDALARTLRLLEPGGQLKTHSAECIGELNQVASEKANHNNISIGTSPIIAIFQAVSLVDPPWEIRTAIMC